MSAITQTIDALTERIKQQQAVIEELRAERNAVRACLDSKWIRCEDRMPEPCTGLVLVFEPQSNTVQSGYFSNGDWSIWGQRWYNTISHWQLMPPPPKL